MTRRDRNVHVDRLLLGEAAVISVSEAARRLTWNERDARRFLEDAGVIRCPDGKHRCVIWGDVLEAIRGRSGPPSARANQTGIVPPRGRTEL